MIWRMQEVAAVVQIAAAARLKPLVGLCGLAGLLGRGSLPHDDASRSPFLQNQSNLMANTQDNGDGTSSQRLDSMTQQQKQSETFSDADLANELGNLAQRSLSMVNKNLDGIVPEPGDFTADDLELLLLRGGPDSVGCGLGTGAVAHGVQVLGGAGQTNRKALDTLASGAIWLSGGHPGGVAGRGNIDHVL